ncbi:hypothetical protein CANCADRAFT_29099 [Tortispora caseinolytica NRRL Y-17796]|uniref:Uncharacterized protein n=1 Tax=Tortispora caseinolytica NRRL Y-17796 TaxID=767744 RepID=A0A1E4TBR4_9ASCO|nr:hypothetical protein CANCADRAFT_29099 [Tortispora caseinolytica NRRL Y-17796]
MFALSPPSTRLGNTTQYTTTLNAIQKEQFAEAFNSVSHPDDTNLYFKDADGRYSLKEYLKLAIPAPHPSTPPVITVNPLSTHYKAAKTGTKLSIVLLALPKHVSTSQSLTHLTSSLQISSRDVSTVTTPPSISLESYNGNDIESLVSNVYGPANIVPDSPAAIKRRKPKGSLIKNNSTLISRIIMNDHFQKRMSEHHSQHPLILANIGRAFEWLDSGHPHKEEFLSKMLFTTANALCHSPNLVTVSSNHLESIIGINFSDIVWCEMFSGNYARLNKNGSINSFPVTQIKWIPNSENLFVASFKDGSIIIFDKEKDDPRSVSAETRISSIPKPTHSALPGGQMNVVKSLQSSGKDAKHNPIAYWQVTNQAIQDFAFSPDGTMIATVDDSGLLKIIDIRRQKVTDIFSSFYGGLRCVSWSPDNKYIVAGGKDDYIHIWSVETMSPIARGLGHRAWVADIKFDLYKTTEECYRFGSVGQDGSITLWDFSLDLLNYPKHIPANNTQRPQANVTESADCRFHPAPSNETIPTITPTVTKKVSNEPLQSLVFLSDSILVSNIVGGIQTWTRPLPTP